MSKYLERGDLDVFEFITALRETGQAPTEKPLVMFTQTGDTWRARFKGGGTTITASGSVTVSLKWMEERRQEHGDD